MKIATFVTSQSDIDRCAGLAQIEDLLVEPAFCARLGKLSLSQALDCAQRIKSIGKRAILVWDVAMTEEKMSKIVTHFDSHTLDIFDAVRVQDIGAAQWVREHSPNKPIQLICESGNLNIQSIQSWVGYFSDQLERVVLSIELPEPVLIDYCSSLSVACEILIAGRILLFYSPRPLLSSQFDSEETGTTWIEVSSSSELSHNREFPTVETVHGTFMYLHKDQYILDKLDKLRAAGLAVGRIDLRHLSSAGNACENIETYAAENSTTEALPSWPVETAAPFFRNNKTTKQLKKLKSPLLSMRDETCLGTVIGTEKGKYCSVQAIRKMDLSQPFRAVTTKGEELSFPHLEFWNSQNEPITSSEEDQVLFTRWLKRVSPGALLFQSS